MIIIIIIKVVRIRDWKGEIVPEQQRHDEYEAKRADATLSTSLTRIDPDEEGDDCDEAIRYDGNFV